jgi:excisionase family DNA binding protein
MERMLYTVDEVAHMLGLGRTKVYELIKLGDLASVLIGQARRIPADAVTDFLGRLLAPPPAAADLHILPVTSPQLSVDGGTMEAGGDVEEAS